MISKQGRFIFFHIPRTGASAVQDCLWGDRTEDKAGSHPRDNSDYLGPYDWHLHGFNQERNKEVYNNEVGDVVGHVGQGLYGWNTNFLGKEKFEEFFKFIEDNPAQISLDELSENILLNAKKFSPGTIIQVKEKLKKKKLKVHKTEKLPTATTFF